MRKDNYLKSLIEKVAIKIAKADVNATCPCISYQPKIPKAVQRLKQF